MKTTSSRQYSRISSRVFMPLLAASLLTGAGQAAAESPVMLQMVMKPGSQQGAAIMFDRNGSAVQKKQRGLSPAGRSGGTISVPDVERVRKRVLMNNPAVEADESLGAVQREKQPAVSEGAPIPVFSSSQSMEEIRAQIQQSGGDSVAADPVGADKATGKGLHAADKVVQETAAPAASAEPAAVIPGTALREDAGSTPHPVAKKKKYPGYEPTFVFTAGHREDKLKWSIAGLGYRPDILSELSWEDIRSFEFATTMKWSNASGIYVRGGFDYGFIWSGDNQDSDYYGDNRTQEFSRSYSDTDSGSVWDAGAGVGYRFESSLAARGSVFRLMPLVGYSIHTQELEDTGGVQVINTMSDSVGNFNGLQSTYKTEWRGPWVGADMELRLNPRHAVAASFEYHFDCEYSADANWNLRRDFAHPVSFEHYADSGEGIVASLNYLYSSSEAWEWNLGFVYRDFEAGDGYDTTYFADGSSGVVPLNGVEWSSWSVFFGFTYHF